MKKYILSIVVTALMLVSCDDFLDIKPKGVSIPEKATEYEQLLNYAQLTKGLEVYMEYMTDDAYVPDKGYGGYEEMDQADRNLYTFQSEIYSPAEYDILWLQSYNRIYYCNVVANQVMAAQGDLAYKQRVRSDALVLRAFDYLGLINSYAKHYDPATAATDPGVPLQLDENITDAPIQRATVKQIYDQIKADLEEAVNYLPDQNLIQYRGSKPFVRALLARMYLCMGNYEQAQHWAEEVLKTHHTLLDMTQCSIVDPDKTVGRTDLPDADENPENINIRYTPYVYGLSGTVYASQDLLNLYDENDMRLKLWFTHKIGSNIVDDLIFAGYFEMNVSSSVQEMMLIVAECAARAKDKATAMKWYNELRKHRILNYADETAVDADEALKKVLNERRREFVYNGLYRWVDLRRLNKDFRFRKTITHTVNRTSYVLEPESPKWILPIPPMVTDMNPDMVINER